MPACSPFALRRTPLGRRKDGKSHVEFHHGEGGPSWSTPTASVEPSLYFEAGSRAIVPARRIGYLENKVRRKNFGVHAFLQYVLTRGLVGALPNGGSSSAVC